MTLFTKPDLANSTGRKGWEHRAIVALAALLFAYVVARGALISLTYDEIGTIFFCRTFEWAKVSESAGVHLLNAVLVSTIQDMGGTSAAALRSPNMVAFLLYLLAAIDLGRHVARPVRLPQFILLTTVPFLTDFFSLSRGYGMGCSGALVGIACALRYVSGGKFAWAVGAVCACMVGLAGNYTVMNCVLAVLAMLFARIWTGSGTLLDKVGRSLLAGLPLSVGALVLLPIMLDLREGGQLYFGGRNGLWQDIVGSLGRCIGYHMSYSSVVRYIFKSVFALALAWSVFGLVGAVRDKALGTRGFIAGLLPIALLAAWAQYALMGTPLPVERTALIYCPLVALALGQCMNEPPWAIARVPGVALASVCAVHFIASANFTHVYSWRYESGSRTAVDLLWDTRQGDIRFGITYEHSPSIWYYREQHHFHRLIVNELSGLWDHCLGLEELDPLYYGTTCRLSSFDEGSMRAFLKPESVDVYYLDDFYLAEMDRLDITYDVIRRFANSRSSLIEHVRIPKPAEAPS